MSDATNNAAPQQPEQEKGFFDKIKDGFENLKDKAADAFDDLKDKADDAWDAAKDAADKLADKAQDAWEDAQEGADHLADKTKAEYYKAKSEVAEDLGAAKQKLKDYFDTENKEPKESA
ncbi:MAG: hypothetical protein QM642_02755 [Edaphocola sp.]